MSSVAKIRLDKVGKTYPGGKVAAVEELNLEVQEGEILVLVGPSGCGKSTTLRLINRMIEPSSGRILLDGEDVTKVNPDHLRRRIGYVIQQIGLFPHQTIAQNIGTVPRMLGWDKKKIADATERLLSTVGLDPDQYRDRYPKELPGGQAQRVGVARALGADPDIMLMDEPFGAIDPITRDRLQNEFLRLQNELRKTIVFVTHDIDEAIKMGGPDRDPRRAQRDQAGRHPRADPGLPGRRLRQRLHRNGSTIKGLNFLKVSSLVLAGFPTTLPGEAPGAVSAKLSDSGQDWVVELDDEQRPVRWVNSDNAVETGEAQEVATRLHTGDTLFQALEQMVTNESGMTVVVDDNEKFQGVIQMTDLAKAIRRAQYEAKAHYEEMEARA